MFSSKNNARLTTHLFPTSSKLVLSGKKGKYICNFQILKWDQEKWKMRKFHFESHDAT